MSHHQPELVCRSVSLSYPTTDGPVPALRDISFTVQRGEFLAVLGPSGCGKTSLLRILAGLQEPTDGAVLVAGTSPPAARRGRQIGYVFQDPVLFDWRTVRANIELPAQVAGTPGYGAEVDELLDVVRLREFENFYPRELSGGMQSRAAIARALVGSPPILLLDEPFSKLDELTREHLHVELLDLWAARRPTTVFVTHSIDEAVFLADEVLVLTSRPGSIGASIRVDLGRPRTLELLASRSYQELVVRVRALARRAAEGLDGGTA